MAKSAKLIPFYQKINPEILKKWKESINRTEIMRVRLEEALLDNAKKHQGEK